jgi:hypothetical protein
MRYSRSMATLFVLGLAGCGGLRDAPAEHGPAWIERPADTLVDRFGQPDKRVTLPFPSLATVYLYTGGALPGFAVCEHDYIIRGNSVIGYTEHGTAPGCNRKAGRTE